MSDLPTAARKVREWTRRRDEMIRQRRSEGATLRQIAQEASLSPAGVQRVLDRG